MDNTTEQLVNYAADFSEGALTAPVLDATMLHLVDSVACAIAGFDSEAARIALKLARRLEQQPGATLIGDDAQSTAEMAAFANTIMVRAWDWNDGMHASGGGHPSDMIAAILAVGETCGASPRDAVVAMVLAYEILGALGTSAPIRELGWDQGTFMAPATALAIGRMLGFDKEHLANAMSLSMVPYLPLFVTRVGALSMWKGCSTAGAMRNAIFAVDLTREGMTGPAEPFEGKSGLWDQVSGPFTLSLPSDPGGPMIVEVSYMKLYPAEGPSQALLGIAPQLRAWTTADEIASIEIETFHHAYQTMASHPAKWDPQNRETADHSLPYLLAVSLVDGEINRSSFTEERILDPSLRPLMQKIAIRENEQFSAEYAPPGRELSGTPRARITVRKHSGDELVEEVTYPKGHAKNPMTVEDVNSKLDAACAGIVDDKRKEEIRETWWNFDRAPDIPGAMSTLARFS